MTTAEIDAFITAMIDAVHDTETGVGHLLAYPTPGADDDALVRLLEATVALCHLGDSMRSLWAASADRAGLPARRRTNATTMMKDLGVAPIAAARSVKVGAALPSVPALASVVKDAGLPGDHAAAVVSGLDHISRRVGSVDADQRDGFVSNLLAQAHSGTPNDVQVWARAAALRLAPPDAPEPVAENRGLNEVSLSTGADGRARLEADLDVLAGEKLRTALDPLMTPVPLPDGSRDPRSTGQRRADALEHVLDAYLRWGERPTTGGHVPHVTVTIPHVGCGQNGTQTTAREPNPEAAALDPLSTLTPPARLGFGEPVSTDAADMIACDCALSLMVVNRDSIPLDIKRADRFFPHALRHALIVRDHGCSFPGCGRPPSWCQAHHTPWSEGGATVLGNGALLCQMHHTQIHHTDWKMRIGTDRHPWFSPPPKREGGPRTWIRSHARRTMTTETTAAA